MGKQRTKGPTLDLWDIINPMTTSIPLTLTIVRYSLSPDGCLLVSASTVPALDRRFWRSIVILDLLKKPSWLTLTVNGVEGGRFSLYLCRFRVFKSTYKRDYPTCPAPVLVLPPLIWLWPRNCVQVCTCYQSTVWSRSSSWGTWWRYLGNGFSEALLTKKRWARFTRNLNIVWRATWTWRGHGGVGW